MVKGMTQTEWLKRADFVRDYKNFESYREKEAAEEELHEMYKTIIPEVGQMCTELLWSDCYAHTIVEVITPNKIRIQQNDYRIKDWVDGEGEILPELVGDSFIITRRKSGNWRAEGCPDKQGEVLYTLAYARTYRDPSF